MLFQDTEISRLFVMLQKLTLTYFSENISIKRGKNGGGKIVIDFSSDEEIESFIQRLNNK